MTGDEIRTRFLRFFEAKGHRILPSDGLVPAGDPTLLFTSAGMVQFKPYFLGQGSDPTLTRAATCQKCFRTPDLERVGLTSRHHTFFEMLGNFSFGDYFKRDAIAWAWEFSTKELGLPAEKLSVSVFNDDEESAAIWREVAGLPDARIHRLGAKDNFWGPVSADGGPCGPCSELYFDRGEKFQGPCTTTPCGPGCDCDRFAEFWNLVFMQFDQAKDGSRRDLPRKCVDTGAGLERIAMIVQGVESNFDTDLFTSLRAAIGTGAGWGSGPLDDTARRSLRVVADHARASAFLVAEGILPGNTGRGYVLRRVVRRAIRYARKIRLPASSFAPLAGEVVRAYGGRYPELAERASAIDSAVGEEALRFEALLEAGLPRIEALVAEAASSPSKVVSGDAVFVLYDTHGFPADLSEEIATESACRVDREGFDRAMEAQRAKAREAWKGSGEKAPSAAIAEIAKGIGASSFVGYDRIRSEARIVAIASAGKSVAEISSGQEGQIVLDRTPLYPEGGGQVGDRGVVETAGGAFRVAATPARTAGIVLHSGRCVRGTLRVGEEAVARVDVSSRTASARNHTSTHVLHATLRERLGEHVHQAGSYVGPDRLRFDFNHARGLTADELRDVENAVNERARDDARVEAVEMSRDDARKLGALAFFGEKYGEKVRVVSIGDFSRELCGGTHLRASGEIGTFKIVSEASVAAGVRRIEALTGPEALSVVAEQERLLAKLRELTKAPGDREALEKVERLLDANRRLERELTEARMGGAAKPADLAGNAKEVGGVRLVAEEVAKLDADGLRAMLDRVREKLRERGAVVLLSSDEGKVSLVTGVTADLKGKLDAGALAKEVAKALGGSGGGRPDMGQGGGKDPSLVGAALAAVPEVVARLVKP